MRGMKQKECSFFVIFICVFEKSCTFVPNHNEKITK